MAGSIFFTNSIQASLSGPSGSFSTTNLYFVSKNGRSPLPSFRYRSRQTEESGPRFQAKAWRLPGEAIGGDLCIQFLLLRSQLQENAIEFPVPQISQSDASRS